MNNTLTKPDFNRIRKRRFQKCKFIFVSLLTTLSVISFNSRAQGTWTTITAPHTSGGLMLLLSDGTIMCKTDVGASNGNLWDLLKPDIKGSYATGKWTTSAAMKDDRLYFSSQVLKDGRVYVAGGEYGSGGSASEVYNPVTNTWKSCPAVGSTISDANSEILPDGRVLQALVNGALKSTKIYDPITNTYSTGPSCIGIHNESTWLKLPDNSLLQVDRNATSSERYIPTQNKWVSDATVSVNLYDPYGLESSAAFLLPDGRGIFFGSLGNSAYYKPSGSASPGSWTTGPSMPNSGGSPDGVGAMMVTGNILLAVSPKPTSAEHFPSPTTLYEFNYKTNTYTAVPSPTGGSSVNSACYTLTMLCMPDGNILFSMQGSSKYYIYKPKEAPIPEGKPTISKVLIVKNGTDCTYKLTGTLFNGISEGASYGDDVQMETNYPIIRLIADNGNVYYARTANWNSTGVMRGNNPDTTDFTLPAGLPEGTYSLVVTSNGFASDPVKFNTCGIATDVATVPNFADKLEIYPNPTNGVVQMVLTASEKDDYTLEIKNTLGQIVYHDKLTSYAGTYTKNVDLSAFGKGMYFLTLSNSTQQGVKKIIVD
jgi:hypothetical protein